MTNLTTTHDANPGVWQSWCRFWFAPRDPIALHAVRLLVGLWILISFIPYAGYTESFFSLRGWFDAQAYLDAARFTEGTPHPITWSLFYLLGNHPEWTPYLYWFFMGATCLFTLGFWTRLTSVITWLGVVSMTASPAAVVEADSLLLMMTFYLMLGYLGLQQSQDRISWFNRIFGSTPRWWSNLLQRPLGPEPESHAAQLALRLVQVHFALIMVISGLHKLQFGDWWAGLALWFPLHPTFETSLEQARAHADDAVRYLSLLSLCAYAVLIWQIVFPLFAWRKPGWWAVMIGVSLGWLGASLGYQLFMFGPLMFTAGLCYMPESYWRRLRFGVDADLPSSSLHTAATTIKNTKEKSPAAV